MISKNNNKEVVNEEDIKKQSEDVSKKTSEKKADKKESKKKTTGKISPDIQIPSNITSLQYLLIIHAEGLFFTWNRS